MGVKKTTTLLDDLIQSAGGCVVIDGGLATQLEKHGAVFNDSLWSAVCLITDPDVIKKVHFEYLEAGADILVSSSYQACVELLGEEDVQIPSWICFSSVDGENAPSGELRGVPPCY